MRSLLRLAVETAPFSASERLLHPP